MAKTRLSAAEFVERGYGQVEGNHLSARSNGQIYAQLPADKSISVLENGQFVKYDYAKGVVRFNKDSSGNSVDGQWLLVFNEIKLYRDFETDEDFAMIAENYGAKYYNAAGQKMPEGTKMVPRCLGTKLGDFYTTNTIHLSDNETLAVGVKLAPNDEDGILSSTAVKADSSMVWKVVKVYTMPDGQPGVKLQRIK